MINSINKIKVGDTASFTKKITERDIQLFAEVSGDINPIHLDAEYAKGTMFKERIAHGMLSGSLISAVIGNQLPGLGTIYLKQELKFLRPVKIDELITAKVTVLNKIEEKNRLELETLCMNEKDEIVISGVALVMPPKGE